MASYETIVYPSDGSRMWPKTRIPPLRPPRVKKQPGRPKKLRARNFGGESRDPARMRRTQTRNKCQKCGVFGHNARGYKTDMGETSNTTGMTNTSNKGRGKQQVRRNRDICLQETPTEDAGEEEIRAVEEAMWATERADEEIRASGRAVKEMWALGTQESCLTMGGSQQASQSQRPPTSSGNRAIQGVGHGAVTGQGSGTSRKRAQPQVQGPPKKGRRRPPGNKDKQSRGTKGMMWFVRDGFGSQTRKTGRG